MASLLDRRTRVERLDAFLRRTWAIRRALFLASMVLPWFVVLVLSFLALYPMLFEPHEKLTTTLFSLLGGGLSFASVAFSAAKSRDDENWALRMGLAGTALLQFSIAMAVAVALNVAREKLVADFGVGTPIDYALRGLLVTVTAGAIGLAFFGFHSIVVLLGPVNRRR